ncbi:MAG: hypothetical protein ABI604_12550, partial [Nitrospirota bacterium]
SFALSESRPLRLEHLPSIVSISSRIIRSDSVPDNSWSVSNAFDHLANFDSAFPLVKEIRSTHRDS